MGKAKRKHGHGSNYCSLLCVAVGMLLGVLVAVCSKQLLLPCGMGLPECCLGKTVASWPPISANYRRKMTGNSEEETKGLHTFVTSKSQETPVLFPSSGLKGASKKSFILIGVMTAQKYLNTRAIAGLRTWVDSIPGTVIFFSSEGSRSISGLPLVALPGVDDSYPPQKKSFMMLKYMYEHFINKYEWFARVDDDIYIRGDKLENFLRSVNSSKAQFIGQAGVGMKEEIGRLSLNVDENFCMGGPGIVFSRETLASVAEHTDYCLKHFYSTHEDVEVGRCVRRFAGIPCTWAFEMQHLFYHNYREEKGSFTHSLSHKEMNRAITLHPVKQPAYLFRMHEYFKERRIMDLYHKQLITQREIASFNVLIEDLSSNKETSPKSEPKLSLQPSLSKFVPVNAEDVLAWEFITKSVFSHTKANPSRGLEAALRGTLDDIVMQIMLMVNKNARQRGRTIDFKEILYGYSRTNPLYGTDYILDLLLIYRKHKGHKMTVPVRRHAYLHQTFLDMEFTEDGYSFGTVDSETTEPPSFLDTVRSKLGFQSSVSSMLNPSVKEMIHFIMPLSGRFLVFQRFMLNFEQLCLETDENVSLHLILYKSNVNKDTDKTVALVHDYQRRYPSKKLEVVFATGTFSRGAGLELGVQQCSENALLFFVDVDIYFTPGVLQRIRANTKRGKQAYFPIVLSQYDPETVPSCSNSTGNIDFCAWEHLDKVTDDYGFWRLFGYGITSLYKNDYIASGGFDKNIHGWGKEDVDLFQKFLTSNVTVFRSVDPGLIHVFHPIKCDPALDPSQYQMCIGTKSASLGSMSRLVDIIKTMPNILAGNLSQGNEPS